MDRSDPEPGFVQAYRLFVITQILFWLVVGPILLIIQVESQPGVTPELVRSTGLVERLSLPNTAPVLLVESLLLLLLLWPRAQRKLGRWFVPLTLVLGLGPLLVGYYWWPTENPLQTPFVMFFFVMLVLIAWEYRQRFVLGYVVGLSLYEMVLSTWPANVPWTVPAGWLVLQAAMMLLVGYVTATFVTVQSEQRLALAEAYRRQAEAHERLRRHAATLEELTTTRERNRLARELHDTLAHSLSAVAVQLEAVRSLWDGQPDKARVLLDRADVTARTGLTESRRALQDLRASPLRDLGLVLAVRELAERAAQRCGATLEVTLPEQLPDELPVGVEQGVYRIVQETLENVVRHAGARNVAVRMQVEGERLLLMVEDDGQGMAAPSGSPEESSSGLGIRGMEERALLIGGQLRISSRPGRGTRVQLQVPLE